MQNKPKKDLYKIIFLVIMLSFIISLTGCDWLSGGIWNIFDPKAQIITEFNPVEGGEPAAGCCNAGVSCINGVEFFITGFAYNYHGVDSVDGKIAISELSRVLEASFYVAPSTSPGTPGPKTIIENIPLFFQDVIDYLYLHPFITEITCDLSLVGVDGAGHNLSFQIASELPIFEPGIDLYPPTAVISATPGITGTAPFNVVFDASGSFDVGSGIADINWDFGDESTGTDITENHTYDIPGAYSVNLTVTDFYGNKGYATVIITVNEAEAPTAIITTTPSPPTGIAPFKVYFDAYESHADLACGFGCEIVSYEWEFGDGDTGTGVTLNHTYSNSGTYMVVLTITDSNGKKGYDSVEVTVSEQVPTAVINTTPEPAEGIVPLTIYFDAYGSESEAGIASYAWNFGDGNTGTGVTSENTYVDAGIYIVYLTITDDNGNKGFATVIVTVNETEAPTAVITTTPESAEGIVPLTIYFDAYGSYVDPACGFECEIVSYEWDFGDGDTGTGVTLNHTYSNIGKYTAILIVTDSNGKKGYDNVEVAVTKEPNAVINTIPDPPTGVAPFIVYFDAYESTSESGIVSYEWDFGDGTTGTGVTAENTYDDAGIYIVYLTIIDSNGYEAYDSVPITVNEAGVPTAVISVTPSDTGVEPFMVYFDASQSSSSYSIVSYAWNFGDTGTGSGITTSHEYTTPGTYIVVLSVTDSNGNTGYASVTITVYEAGVPWTITLQANPTTVTAGGGTSLITATVKDAGGDPVTDGTVVTFIATSPGILSDITVTTGGIASATLTLTNSGTETISSTVGATSGIASDNITVYCPPPTP